MTKLNKKVYISEILFIVLTPSLLFFTRLLPAKKLIISIYIILYYFSAKHIVISNQKESIKQKEITKYLFILAFGYMLVYYVLGIYFGFYKSIYSFNFKNLINYIIPITIIIITFEKIRKKLLISKTIISHILIYIMSIIIDITIYLNIININNMEQIIAIIGQILLPSIMNTFLFNYISNQYGAKPNIIYRLLITLPSYILPYEPDLYAYFIACCRITYPAIIYWLLKESYAKKKINNRPNKYSKNIISISFIIFIVIIISLISCKLKYGMLVVGSESMEKAIYKGDAIVFTNNININKLKIGDVILYAKDNEKILHRIVKIEEINAEQRFYTKGDNNKDWDKGYVKKDQIIGKINFKIPKIGYPTLWVHELAKRIK